ncbi:MAG TPA: PspA/IM30 family protein [Methanocella sp.]|jgi:phage shock protein A
MGLFRRLAAMAEARISMLIDGFENPGEVLDYSYRRQLELSHRIKKGIASVIVARKRLELEKTSLEGEVTRLDRSAREAIALGKENLAEIAVRRKVQWAGQIEALDKQIESLLHEQGRLAEMNRRLDMKIEAFCTEKETIKAWYSAAQAKVGIQEAATGLGREMDYVGHAVRMAQEKTRELQARSEALDELAGIGAVEDVSGGGDIVERELSRVRNEQAVKAELEKLTTRAGH